MIQLGLYWDYYVGVDLGQSHDYTALCVIEEPTYVDEETASKLFMDKSGWLWSHTPTGQETFTRHQWRVLHQELCPRPAKPPLAVRHLERFELDTRYPVIVDRVAKLMNSAQLRGRAVLVVDDTGVGRAVTDMLEDRGLFPVGVTLTGGNTVKVDESGRRIHVPKRDVICTTQVLLQNKRLSIAGGLPETDVLVKELLAYKVTISKNGHDSYGNDWRENPHDDLVLAVALAGWYREWLCVHLDDMYTGMPAGDADDAREVRAWRRAVNGRVRR